MERRGESGVSGGEEGEREGEGRVQSCEIKRNVRGARKGRGTARQAAEKHAAAGHGEAARHHEEMRDKHGHKAAKLNDDHIDPYD